MNIQGTSFRITTMPSSPSSSSSSSSSPSPSSIAKGFELKLGISDLVLLQLVSSAILRGINPQ
ncbi:hypothetical protein LguiA_007977 [Lonicera macranthoides]